MWWPRFSTASGSILKGPSRVPPGGPSRSSTAGSARFTNSSRDVGWRIMTMPTSRTADATVNVPVDDVRDLLTRLFLSKSLFRFDAEAVAQRLIEADLRGLHDYGAAMALRILQALAAGDIDPRGRVL